MKSALETPALLIVSVFLLEKMHMNMTDLPLDCNSMICLLQESPKACQARWQYNPPCVLSVMSSVGLVLGFSSLLLVQILGV